MFFPKTAVFLGVVLHLFHLHGCEQAGRASDFNLSHGGVTATTLEFFQLGVDCNVQQIINNFNKVVALINDTTTVPYAAHYRGLFGNYVNLNIHRLQVLGGRLQNIWDLGMPIDGGDRGSISSPRHREERAAFLLGLAAPAFQLGSGIYKAVQLHQLKKQLLNTNKRVDDLSLLVQDQQVTLGHHGRRITALEDWAANTDHKIDTLELATTTQIYIDNLIEEVEDQVTQASTIMDGLLDGRLSHLALTQDAMTGILRNMSTKAAANDRSLLVQSPADIFAQQASYVPTELGFLAIVHVAAARSENLMTLWKLVRTPLQISPDLHMTIHTDYEAIAVSGDGKTFRPLTLAQLTVCVLRAGFHYCPEGNVHLRADIIDSYDGALNDALCIYFVFASDFEHIRTACRFSIHPPIDQAFLLSGTSAVFVASKPMQGTRECPDGESNTFLVQGILQVSVADRCVVSTPYYSVTGVEDSTKNAKRGLVWPSTLPPLWADLDLELLHVLEQEGTTDVPTATPELRIYLAEAKIHRAAYTVRIVLGCALGLIFILGALGFTWVWRHRLLLQRRMRALLVQGVDRLLDVAAAHRLQDVEAARRLLPAGVELAEVNRQAVVEAT